MVPAAAPASVAAVARARVRKRFRPAYSAARESKEAIVKWELGIGMGDWNWERGLEWMRLDRGRWFDH